MGLPNAYYLIDEIEFERALTEMRRVVGSVVQQENCFDIEGDGRADGVTLWIEARQDEGIYLGVLVSFPTGALESTFSRVCKILEEGGGTRLTAIQFSKITAK